MPPESPNLQETERALERLRHRAKNDLQLISSLLRLQARAGGVEAQKALFIASRRVRVIALGYEAVDTNGSPMAVDMQGYLERIASMVISDRGSAGIRAAVSASGARFALEAGVPCGLLVNETLEWILSFTSEQQVTLWLDSSSATPRDFTLGIACSSADRAISGAPPRIVELLLEQLGAKLATSSSEGGAKCLIHFSLPSSELG